MDFDDHKNFAIGDIITAPIPALSGTTLTLSPGQVDNFPATPFNATAFLGSVASTIDNSEIVRVTNISTDTLTIEREQEGTNAMVIAVGWKLVASITAKTLEDIEEFVNDVNIDVGDLEADLVAAVDDLQDEIDEKSQLSQVRNEVPGGLVNGANTSYTTASAFATGSLRVYKNGIRLKGGGADFTEGSSAFTMVTAPATSTVLLVDYEVGNATFSIGTNSNITGETPTGTINSVTTLFTAARAYIAGSLQVWLNGLLQTPTTDYVETSPAAGTFTFVTAPTTGDILRISYQYNLNPSGNSDTVDGIHANATATANQLYPLNASGYFPASVLRGQMWWEELGRSTLGVAGDTMTINITARKYLMLIWAIQPTGGTINPGLRFNNDSTGLYSSRLSQNGGADSTPTSNINNYLDVGGAAADNFYGTMEILNIATIAKMSVSVSTVQNGTQTGAPGRREQVQKWYNIVNQITQINVFNDGGTGDFAIGSEVVVLGHD